MKIGLTSVIVNDQKRAHDFYTRVLGFATKVDVPAGEYRWLTVVSPEAPDGTQLLLEPSGNPAARTYQRALFEQGIPLASFGVADVEKEYQRLKGLGVVFRTPPTPAGPTKIAMFEDTCGNLIQMHQE